MKFNNRFKLIRLQESEQNKSGCAPKISKLKDPFWDPPNPILLGQSFLELSPLSYVCEHKLDAAILSVDGNNGKNGFLKVSYQPCDKQGGPFLDDFNSS